MYVCILPLKVLYIIGNTINSSNFSCTGYKINSTRSGLYQSAVLHYRVLLSILLGGRYNDEMN